MSMLENLKKLEAAGTVGGSDYFKPQNGNNIIRVLTEGVHNINKFGNDRFVMFVIDRRDGKVKPYFAPYTVYKAIASLEEDPFFKFQGMPMPFDVNLKAENAGTKDVEYTVQASPNRTDITADELVAAKEKGSITEYVRGLKDQESAQKALTQTPAEIVAQASGGKFNPRPSPSEEAELGEMSVDDIPTK